MDKLEIKITWVIAADSLVDHTGDQDWQDKLAIATEKRIEEFFAKVYADRIESLDIEVVVENTFRDHAIVECSEESMIESIKENCRHCADDAFYKVCAEGI